MIPTDLEVYERPTNNLLLPNGSHVAYWPGFTERGWILSAVLRAAVQWEWEADSRALARTAV